jgi:thermitase
MLGGRIVPLYLLAVALLLGSLFGSVASAAEEVVACGPFDQLAQVAVDFEMNETGIMGSTSDGSSQGRIVGLPEADATAEAEEAAERASEALLALPKDGSGAIPTDFELGPGARIARSFFSPVICATVARVTGPPGATLEQLVTVVPDNSIVVPNDVYASAARPPANIAPPNPDPYTSLQYGLAMTGVREARLLGDGTGARVALLDSAPDVGHRDLGEPELLALADGEAAEVGVHGTLMAGVIRAVEDNGFGIAGVAPGADLVAIPICVPSGGAGGTCTIFQLLQGLDRAWEAEAQLVNLSLSGPPNPLLERGVARLDELGVVVVAAAGNEGVSEPRYPAAYPSVIGVGALDREGVPFARSNRGGWVELWAPGVEILSTVPGSAFAFGNGTSLAAAHVTGMLAILTGVTRDAKLARGELFRTTNAAPGAATMPKLPPVCEVLARLEVDCRAQGAETLP